MSEPECRCGQSIGPTDVTKFGFYERLFGLYFVHVKFQCPACLNKGETFLSQEQWEQGLNLGSPLGMHFMRIKPKTPGAEPEPPSV